MSNFKVGQKVVCVIEDNSDIYMEGINDIGPKLNEIVTINWIGIQSLTNDPSLGFEEYSDDDCCWAEYQFRPLHHEFAEEVISMLLEQPETVEVCAV